MMSICFEKLSVCSEIMEQLRNSGCYKNKFHVISIGLIESIFVWRFSKNETVRYYVLVSFQFDRHFNIKQKSYWFSDVQMWKVWFQYDATVTHSIWTRQKSIRKWYSVFLDDQEPQQPLIWDFPSFYDRLTSNDCPNTPLVPSNMKSFTEILSLWGHFYLLVS